MWDSTVFTFTLILRARLSTDHVTYDCRWRQQLLRSWPTWRHDSRGIVWQMFTVAAVWMQWPLR